MIRLLWLSLSKSWQEQFPGRGAIVAELIASVLDVLLYYFTSKALGTVVLNEFQNQNYFEYVLWGEVLLALPTAAFLSFTRSIRSAVNDGTWEILLMAPRPLAETLFVLSQGDLVRQICRGLLVLGMGIALGADFSLSQLATGAVLLVFSLPLFLALGLIAAAGFLRLERGFGALSHLSHVLPILAGVYFPISVLPTWLSESSRLLSPWTWLLEGSRGKTSVFEVSLALLVGAIVIGLPAFKLFSLAIKHQKKNGHRLILNL